MSTQDVSTSELKTIQNASTSQNKESLLTQKQTSKSKAYAGSVSINRESPRSTDLESDDLDDDDFLETASSDICGTPDKIKLLPPSVLKDIEQKNLARKLAGLAPIQVRVRRCLACGSSFQSSGNRTCGCTSRAAGTIAGREII